RSPATRSSAARRSGSRRIRIDTNHEHAARACDSICTCSRFVLVNPSDTMSLTLQFDAGTLILSNAADALIQSLPGVRFDERTAAFRIEARHYRAIVEVLRQRKIDFIDEARAYQPLECKLRLTRTPFPHQQEALSTWWNAGGRGVVVLPT